MAYHQIDLAGLRSHLQDRWEGVPFWTVEEANDAINEALHQWNILTGQWRGRFSVVLQPQAGPWIPLPVSLTVSSHVQYNGKSLISSDVDTWDMAYPHWESNTTASGGTVPTEVSQWAPGGLYMIAIWPADAVGHSSLVIDGVAQTPVLVNDGDYLNLTTDEVNTILDYAVHVCSFSQGAGVLKNTSPLLSSFYSAAALRNSKLQASDLFKMIESMDFRRFAHPTEAFRGDNRSTNPVMAAAKGQ